MIPSINGLSPGTEKTIIGQSIHGVGQTIQSKRKMADYKTEIFFIGQIVGGSDFPTDLDGLFVEASLKYGAENWTMFADKPSAL